MVHRTPFLVHGEGGSSCNQRCLSIIPAAITSRQLVGLNFVGRCPMMVCSHPPQQRTEPALKRLTAAFVNLLVIAAVCVLPGCGDSPPAAKPLPESKPVTGKVTLGGEPLADARIFFAPKGTTEGQGASGSTDSQGVYVLTTTDSSGRPASGCIPGEYKVTVSKIVRGDGTVVPPDSQEPPMMSGGMESIPLEYSDFTSTKLTANVGPEGGTIDLTLEKK